ncbi:MAG: hypothetical protein WKF82_05290 [Nocardioidaceae bacterium]
MFVPYPGSRQNLERLCVDLRSEAKLLGIWTLRLGIDVSIDPLSDSGGSTWEDESSAVDSLARARVRANDLAMAMMDSLITSRFSAHLGAVGQDVLAAAMQPRRGDGLRRNGRDAEVAAGQWRTAAEAGTLTRQVAGLPGVQPRPWPEAFQSEPLRRRQPECGAVCDAGRRGGDLPAARC